MTVIIEGQLASMYQKPEFKDKDTGEVRPGKHILQLQSLNELKNGEKRLELYNVSIPDSLVSTYKEKIGETVQVRCKFFTENNTPVKFYGV
ncbi:hypothetical protein NNO_2077 [Hydrogenimonas sp.]|nr:hypothetical protein NNO_1501 [Hydrogenimonas sp.]BBG66780.1 hypothetical protein NNO_2077 [Hydrogenimonas sp.]